MKIKYTPTAFSKKHQLHLAAKKISDQLEDADDSNTDEQDVTTRAEAAFNAKFNQAIGIISNALDAGGAPEFAALKKLAVILLDPNSGDPDNRALLDSLSLFEDAASHNDKSSDLIRRGLLTLFLAILENTTVQIAPSITAEKLRLKPLAAGNRLKAATTERAREIATALWVDDKSCSIKTSEMAGKVWAQLVDEGHADQLPDNVERVRIWIRVVAPEYAKAKGRPKKRSA